MKPLGLEGVREAGSQSAAQSVVESEQVKSLLRQSVMKRKSLLLIHIIGLLLGLRLIGGVRPNNPPPLGSKSGETRGRGG